MGLLTSSRLHYSVARILTLAGSLFAALTITTGARSSLEDVEDGVCVIWMFTYFAIDVIASAVATPIVLGKQWNRVRDEGRKADGRVDHVANYLLFMAVGDLTTLPVAILNLMQAAKRIVNPGRYGYEHNLVTDVVAASLWLGVFAYIGLCHAELIRKMTDSSRRIRLMANEQVALDGEDDDEGSALIYTRRTQVGTGFTSLSATITQDWKSHYVACRLAFLITWTMTTTTALGLQYRCDMQDAVAKQIVEGTAKMMLTAIYVYGTLTIFILYLLYNGRLKDFREQGSFSKSGRWTRFACLYLALWDVSYTIQALRRLSYLHELLRMPADTACVGWSMIPGARAVLASMILFLLAVSYCDICQLDLLRRSYLAWRSIRRQRNRQLAEEQNYRDDPLPEPE